MMFYKMNSSLPYYLWFSIEVIVNYLPTNDNLPNKITIFVERIAWQPWTVFLYKE